MEENLQRLENEYRERIKDLRNESLKFKLKFMKAKGLNSNNSNEFRIINEEIKRRERQRERMVGDQ
ncbi:hypothetical protein [Anaerococcus vaginalis]|uniref:hypothetical protein n=1 Tax=Anaerococcus vaginalis TaxID=33037 RepID=UPI00290D155B|nr:hypothetical protein [Anaerococcus vaginalis]MDU5824055.1 hypothetical protein [Anaerococcus vaginalis]MDU7141390.1 hypothetical protein [Anaerococcus vaginalis]